MLQTTKMNFEQLLSFQKTQLQSVSIFFKLVHQFLLLYLLCYFNVLSNYISVLLSLVAFPAARIFSMFRDTARLI